MPKQPKRSNENVTEEQKQEAFESAIRKLSGRLGVNADLLPLNIRFGPTSTNTEEREHELAKALGLQIPMQYMKEHMLPLVRTQEQLQDLIQMMDAFAEQAPSIARQQLDRIKSVLPRSGGPGREPKLNAIQSQMACDEISSEIRLGAKAKEAAKAVAARSQQLFGKTVSARTLGTIWSRRNEYFPKGSSSKS